MSTRTGDRTTTSRLTRAGVGTLALVAALAAAGCSGDGRGTGGEPAGTSEQTPGGETGGASADVGASGAGVRDQALSDVLVEQTVPLPGSPDDEVTLGVRSLTVEGEVMVLRMVVTPDLASVGDDETVSLFDVLRPSTFRPTLVDRENLTEYSLISEPPDTWASDSVEAKALNGTPFPVWGVFAAPQDDVDVLDLRVTDVWPEFTDVPVTR